MKTPKQSVIPRVLARMMEDLLEEQLLELSPGATVEELVEALMSAFEAAPAFSQAVPLIEGVLLNSPAVDELYADTDTLREHLTAAQP